MGDIIPLGNITKLDLDPDMILESAKGEMNVVILIGEDKDGEMYFASTAADGGTVLWWLEHAKKALLEIEETD